MTKHATLQSGFRYAKKWIGIVLAVTFLGIFLQRWAFDVMVVKGDSMEGVLSEGDTLIVQRFDMRAINRFDLVTALVVGETESRWIVKRVIGLPGETVEIDDLGRVLIDNKKLSSDVQIEDVESLFPIHSANLNDNEYFLMGDNRADSVDSRHFGAFARAQIRGIVICRLYPFTCNFAIHKEDNPYEH